MRDRLADLALAANINDVDVYSIPVESDAHMDEFFKAVGEVRLLVQKIISQVDEVVKRHNVILSVPNPDNRTKDELEHLTSDIKKNANLVRAKLKSMQESLSGDENANRVSVDHRIQKNQHSNLMRWFVDVMTGYNETQVSFREKCKARIQRHLAITGKIITDEEMEEILLSSSPAIFTSDIISDSQITRHALNEIESRHQDFLRLESVLRELQELFEQIAMLVDTQGEMLNNIEKNVSGATEHVAMAKEETKKAVVYQKKARRVWILPSFKTPAAATTPAEEKHRKPQLKL